MFGNNLLNFNYVLFNVKNYTEKELLEMASLMSSVFYIEQGRRKDEFKERVIKLLRANRNLSPREMKLLFGWINNLFGNRLGKEAMEEVLSLVEGGGEKMVHGIEIILEQERTDGGNLKAKEIAKNMLDSGEDLIKIKLYTGLTIEEIEELKNPVH